MNQDWKQFTKTVTHELRDEPLSPEERAELVDVAAMLSVTKEKALPSEALLNRILKESASIAPAKHALYEDKKKSSFSFSTLPVFFKNLFSQKKWLLASGSMAMLLIIVTLSFSASEKTFYAQQSWFPKLESILSSERSPSLVATESLSEKTMSENVDSEAMTSKTSSPQKEGSSEEDINTLLAFTVESEALAPTLEEDTAFQNMDQDVNSLSQLYDENGF